MDEVNHSERRNGKDRRGGERRSSEDRRKKDVPVAVERRKNVEDRRSRPEHRGDYDRREYGDKDACE